MKLLLKTEILDQEEVQELLHALIRVEDYQALPLLEVLLEEVAQLQDAVLPFEVLRAETQEASVLQQVDQYQEVMWAEAPEAQEVAVT